MFDEMMLFNNRLILSVLSESSELIGYNGRYKRGNDTWDEDVETCESQIPKRDRIDVILRIAKEERRMGFQVTPIAGETRKGVAEVVDEKGERKWVRMLERLRWNRVSGVLEASSGDDDDALAFSRFTTG